MSEFTPGPWEAGKALFHKDSGEGELFSDGDVHIYPPLGGGPGPVAIVAGEDNARLIAAAPDMLKALRSVEDYCRHGGDLEAMLEEVQATIAAAVMGSVCRGAGEDA